MTRHTKWCWCQKAGSLSLLWIEFGGLLQYVETDLQQLQLRLHHEAQHTHAAIEAEYKQHAKSKPPKRPLHLQQAAGPALDTSATLAGTDTSSLSRFKRRCATFFRIPSLTYSLLIVGNVSFKAFET